MVWVGPLVHWGGNADLDTRLIQERVNRMCLSAPVSKFFNGGMHTNRLRNTYTSTTERTQTWTL